MQTDTLSISQDPMGAAIRDFHMTGKAGRLRVLSSMFEEDEMPVAHLFRTFKDMPRTEQRALEEAYGNVLDIGAGAGCHALELQQRGKSVKAIDISPLSCEVMEERGVKDVECMNVFNPTFIGQFDTILLLMNGTGIAGKLSNLPNLLNRLKQLISKDGQILIDSSDLKYIYMKTRTEPSISTLTDRITERWTIRWFIVTSRENLSIGYIQTRLCLKQYANNAV